MGKNMDLDGNYDGKHIVDTIQEMIESGSFSHDLSSLTAINSLLHVIGCLEEKCMDNLKAGFEISATQCLHKEDGIMFRPEGGVSCVKEERLKRLHHVAYSVQSTISMCRNNSDMKDIITSLEGIECWLVKIAKGTE